MKGYYTQAGKPRCAAEKPAVELLETVFQRWRREARQCLPCFVNFRPAVVERLSETQPHWRLYAEMLSRRVIRPTDYVSARLDKLHRLFIAGKAPIEDLDDINEAAEPELAVAAE